MRYTSHAMQGLSQAAQQHEQLLGVLRARLLGSEPCPAPAIPCRIVGMCMRYQQSVAAMMKDGAPVSLTGAFQCCRQCLLPARQLCKRTTYH